MNKRCDFKTQLLRHSNKHFRMIVLTDIENYINSLSTLNTEQNDTISVTEAVMICNLNNLHWVINSWESADLKMLKLNSNK